MTYQYANRRHISMHISNPKITPMLSFRVLDIRVRSHRPPESNRGTLPLSPNQLQSEHSTAIQSLEDNHATKLQSVEVKVRASEQSMPAKQKRLQEKFEEVTHTYTRAWALWERGAVGSYTDGSNDRAEDDEGSGNQVAAGTEVCTARTGD